MPDDQETTNIEEADIELETASTQPDEAIAEIVLIRGGTPTEISYTITNRAVIGRFDPAVGPIEIDLGNLEEGVYVSRKHAVIYHDQGEWLIEDLGSSNGTFILPPGEDFIKIDSLTRIFDHQEIAFGNVRFRFDIKPQQDSQQATPQAEALEETVIDEIET